MSFRCNLGLTALLFACTAGAQTDSAPVTISVPDEAPPAMVTELTDAHGSAEPGNADAGAAKAAVCGACHGADGNATDPQYPKLAGQHERYIARQLALFKTGERANPIMMGFAAPLSPQDMRDLGAHYAGQTAQAGMADDGEITLGPNAGRKFYQPGEQLWRGGDTARAIPACAACHGPAGNGNPGPPYPRVAGQHAGYTRAQLSAFRDGAVYGSGDNANAVMAGIAAQLTDEEIQSLASYIEGLYDVHATTAAGSR
jgi:cytochrome c553